MLLGFNRFLDQPDAEEVFPADLETPTESTRNSEEMNGITLERFVVPSQNEESETDEFGENPVVTFHLIEDGSQKGKEKLADSNGYTYTVYRQDAYRRRKQGLDVQCQKQDRLVESQCHSERSRVYKREQFTCTSSKTWCCSSYTNNKRR